MGKFNNNKIQTLQNHMINGKKQKQREIKKKKKTKKQRGWSKKQGNKVML